MVKTVFSFLSKNMYAASPPTNFSVFPISYAERNMFFLME